jgi:prepilin-type N-terminal cleavage/methylation domain-containing protein
MMRRGFTLIEMIAVVAITALLAASVVLTLAHMAGQHRYESVCRELEQADATIRSAARQGRHGQELVYDLDNNAVLWQQSANSTTTLVRLPPQISLQLRTADEQLSRGRVEIACSEAGLSQSYALCLEQGNVDHWMIVAGLSGQVFWTDDDRQVDTIFRSLQARGLEAPAGADAH